MTLHNQSSKIADNNQHKPSRLFCTHRHTVFPVRNTHSSTKTRNFQSHLPDKINCINSVLTAYPTSAVKFVRWQVF